MKKIILFAVILYMTIPGRLWSQVLYVDAVKGSDEAPGTLSAPLASLEKAADLADGFTRQAPVIIKIAPGLYKLTRTVKITSPAGRQAPEAYTLEAMVMPGDTNWRPNVMPVIQSVSANNTYKDFDHCAGIEVFRNKVCIRGLKFVGNANPGADYYYPIERDSAGLQDLEISQCYFIGDKNSAPIQGALYTQGAGIHVDHCIFFGCKHDLLLFEGIRSFSLTHSILYGSYGAAVWFGTQKDPDQPFTFNDNIIAACNYFWALATTSAHPLCRFTNSLIAGNEHYLAVRVNGNLTPFDGDDGHAESGILRSGKVSLNEVTIKGMPHDFLSLAPGSAGTDIDAGIFKRQ